MKDPVWRVATIDKEKSNSNFESTFLPAYAKENGATKVSVMWIFAIKADGTRKEVRLIDRGHRMIPGQHYDPFSVFCGNGSAVSIRLALAIAALRKMDMAGFDVEGA